MADKLLVGSNWSAAGSWSPVNVPASNDRVFIGPNSPSVTDGLDQGGIDLDLLFVHPDYPMANSVGADGSPLLIAADKVVVCGGGGFYYQSDLNAAALKTDLIHIMTKSPSTVVKIGSNPADAGDIDAIVALRGNVVLEGNIEFGASAYIRAGYVASSLSDLHMTIASGADTLSLFEQYGGVVYNYAPTTAARLIAGTHYKEGEPIITCDIWRALCVWNDETIAGDAVTVNIWGEGTLDLMGNGLIKELSTVLTTPGAKVFKNEDLHTITTSVQIGNALQYMGTPR
jgi:hypothetical protein